MATNTTNFSLVKPAYTDTADIADINGNMDKVDVSLNGLADAIAIVANNNTHAAITAGQYVYVHGHGSLAEGLYTAKSNISANATLSTSNLQADGSGGLNALNSNISSKSNLMELNVPANGSATIPFKSPALRGIAFNNSSAIARMGLWIVYITSNSATIREVVSSDMVSLAQGSNGLVVSNSSTGDQILKIIY